MGAEETPPHQMAPRDPARRDRQGGRGEPPPTRTRAEGAEVCESVSPSDLQVSSEVTPP